MAANQKKASPPTINRRAHQARLEIGPDVYSRNSLANSRTQNKRGTQPRRRFLGPVWPSVGFDFDEQRRFSAMQPGNHNGEDREEIKELRLELVELQGDVSRLRKRMAFKPVARAHRVGPIDVGGE